jgi:hypothetical protein
MWLPTINISVSANVVAFYAAIMSSVTAGVQFFNYLRDRAKLQVKASLRRIAVSTDGKTYAVATTLPVSASSKTFVVITALNLGRRPVKINGWGGKYITPKEREGFVVVPVGMPKILTEWESIDEMTDELHDSIGNIKYLYVYDASGREWKVKGSDLKKIKSDFSALQAKSSSP